ncbi:MAG TPA: UDP-N-acetylmuramyl-tripeptide synthetase [Candidatus Tetragenococcus pullicola]|nr:UDP-N-acetylmuramyl-tripeptide synthetase [Candidatus Tetragenococcus pullicola]
MYSLTLTEVYQLLDQHHLLKKADESLLDTAIAFTYLSYDSRDIKADTLFFCKGKNFKAQHLDSVIDQGVEVYLSEKHYETVKTEILVTDIREAMAIIAQKFYHDPQEHLIKIGITGTKGKTTAAYFLFTILSHSLNQSVALFSSEETTVDGKTMTPSKLTTPEALVLYRQMAQAVNNGLTHVVMEVSSQAYKTKRVFGLSFDIGIFLNISPDHISPIEHPTFEDYFFCKRQLIQNSKQMILNHDSNYYEILADDCQKVKVPFYSYGHQLGTYQIKDATEPHSFALYNPADPFLINGDYRLALLGAFNHENAAAVILAAHLLGISRSDIQDSLPKSQIPGRMNLLKKPNGAYIFIDYAHNYLSIKAIGDFAKQLRPKGRVIIMTGSAGGKALSRRPDIGKALSECADVVFLTSDDPAFEDPGAITAEIHQAITNPAVTVYEELDRKKAVVQAFSMAKKEDTVILAGKGTEQMMKVHDTEVPYEGDFQIVKRLIDKPTEH